MDSQQHPKTKSHEMEPISKLFVRSQNVEFYARLHATIERLKRHLYGDAGEPPKLHTCACISTPSAYFDDRDYPQRIFRHGRTHMIIGPNGTTVRGSAFKNISWERPAAATRKLLSLVFSNHVLATHTLSGNILPAFHGHERPTKLQLDQRKTADIVHCIQKMCSAPRAGAVRYAITAKCAGVAKLTKELN